MVLSAFVEPFVDDGIELRGEVKITVSVLFSVAKSSPERSPLRNEGETL